MRRETDPQHAATPDQASPPPTRNALAQIDDVVDAIPVHLGCGMWGVFAASLFATKDNCEYAIAVAGDVQPRAPLYIRTAPAAFWLPLFLRFRYRIFSLFRCFDP